MEAEYLTIVIIALATIGLYLFTKYRKNILFKTQDIADELEDLVEDATGIDIEISEAVNEVVEDALKIVEQVLEDANDDGVVSMDVYSMTVKTLRSTLKEQGLSATGNKAQLIERLVGDSSE
tara:strand:+ start:3470 stop:3835 length:366 start_codon:yes stop_codon:yes gene_type:complete